MIGVRIANLLSKCLVDGDFSNYFSTIPSAADCAEPIVLREGGFTRESRIEGEERGTVPVDVYVVREVAGDAEAVAVACEQWVRGYGWERHSERWPWRVVGLDTSAPVFDVRDSSGRFVWKFTVTVTVVRSVG